ncbi:MAG: cell division protein ZapD [Gammaproteobacteria bacterium]
MSDHSKPVVPVSIFEHPMTERMRSFLRLESVLGSTHTLVQHTQPDFSRAALAMLLELAALSERGEIKRDILSELERQRIVLSSLREQAGIDDQRLRSTLSALEHEQHSVESLPERVGQRLKSNDFITAVRSRSSIPGGTCSFDLPSLHCWLTRPEAERLKDLSHWYEEFTPIASAVKLLLKHIREATESSAVRAVGGIYEYQPPSENPPVLLRINLPAHSKLYPMVSGGKHRVTIQFHHWNGVDARDEVQRRDIDFELAFCRL